MESIVLDILDTLRAHPDEARLDSRTIQAIIRAHNNGLARNEDHFAKKQLLPFYLGVKANDPERWARWGIDAATEKRLLATLQVKPRRTASGVATITVITRPAPCKNACLYCPNDVRMPKSYLHDEPACQRAERNFFDPYLQVISRARALHEMGHAIDKIELIVLGGTWCDYPESYQTWFARELFRACNDIDAELSSTARLLPDNAANRDVGKASDEFDARAQASQSQLRRTYYQDAGLTADAEELEQRAAATQQAVTQGDLTYNQGVARLYGESAAWQNVSMDQTATLLDLEREQQKNATAAHRVVGFVVETRPDTITPARLALLRNFGCTKVQMGIQSLDEHVLAANGRPTDEGTVTKALALARLFGFKLHTHFMVNLAGATPESDRADYRRFVTENAFLPDEVKLYPCALVGGTGLCRLYDQKKWRPYTEDELLGILCDDARITPAYCRISRMIRDISAGDILVGNKKTNLRQMVEQRLESANQAARTSADAPSPAFTAGTHASSCSPSMTTCAEREPQPGRVPIQEIRMREISTQDIDIETLALDDVAYDTAISREHFLQWITPQGKIAGFLRLSLPDGKSFELLGDEKSDALIQAKRALGPDAAMIREVHVYGRAAHLGKSVDGAQHSGLGRKLIARAEDIARSAGYSRLNVISSVGTREYYDRLGFKECGLYQQKPL